MNRGPIELCLFIFLVLIICAVGGFACQVSSTKSAAAQEQLSGWKKIADVGPTHTYVIDSPGACIYVTIAGTYGGTAVAMSSISKTDMPIGVADCGVK